MILLFWLLPAVHRGKCHGKLVNCLCKCMNPSLRIHSNHRFHAFLFHPVLMSLPENLTAHSDSIMEQYCQCKHDHTFADAKDQCLFLHIQNQKSRCIHRDRCNSRNHSCRPSAAAPVCPYIKPDCDSQYKKNKQIFYNRSHRHAPAHSHNQSYV